MSVYYNEKDAQAAAVLRELIREGFIAYGDVDDRSIEDVIPRDIAGYTQVHLFAGYGIWSLGFRLAGWPDRRPAWSASCPCQPFSAAGKGAGFADERHLWPSAFHLVQHAKRSDVPLYGEQVASPDGLAWLDLVCTDMEAEDHTVWPFDLCSAGVGAPVIRQRTYWMARSKLSCTARYRADRGTIEAAQRLWDRLTHSGFAGILASTEGLGGGAGLRGDGQTWSGGHESPDGSNALRMDGTSEPGLEGFTGHGDQALRWAQSSRHPRQTGAAGGMVGSDGWDTRAEGIQRGGQYGLFAEDGGTGDGHSRPGPTNGFWAAADWLRCRDELWRPVEPGTFPLAHGYPERVGLLRGAGNAINPFLAKEFIEASEFFD